MKKSRLHRKNSRKRRFWKQWEKVNEALAETDVVEANIIREIKFLGCELPDYIKCSDYNEN